MTYEDLIVLIPSHSLEDFPTELGESEAAGLLNAFAVVWHPLLLASANVIPSWHRADEPPETCANRLIMAPPPCDDWLPSGWVERARKEGAIVVSSVSDRETMHREALSPLESTDDVDPDLAADFFALGTCFLQLELLTRHMHHFSTLDEVHLQREAVSAAEAALAHDAVAARSHLRTCFEVLTEARERFYPVDCYLLDLCLLIPRLADDHFDRTLAQEKPINFLVTAEDLEHMQAESPERIVRLNETWETGTAEVIGGEWRDGPNPLLPVESVLWQFRRGHETFRNLFGRTPKTWGRRRYGLSTLMPLVLSRRGYQAALHVVLDDGIYPDAEYSKIRWEGCDGSVIDATTRIPLAADSAASFLRFPLRMAESMEEDQVAAILFARWPELTTPWLEDFRRIHSFSPVLGRFLTFQEFFQQTDDPGRLSTFEAREYLSPFLIQAVARQMDNPISRFSEHTLRRRRFDAACWYRAVAALLSEGRVSEDVTREQERLIEDAGPDAEAPAVEHAETGLNEWTEASVRQLADVLMNGAGNRPGVLLLNPLSFPRRVPVDVPSLQRPPAVAGPIKGVQFDGTRQTLMVEVPAAGFAWIPTEAAAETNSSGTGISTAEENLLRNEFFEVYINEATGGIAEIKTYTRRYNRISQQLAFRFPHERSVTVGEGEDADQFRTPYSEMRCLSSEVTCDGPLLGEIVTAGELVDQTDGSKLAGYRQTVRVWRGKPWVEIDIELDVQRLPEGNPWLNYYTVRFAWNDDTAALTRSVQEGAHSLQGDRFESPHYIEIATEEERTTILTLGLPFHRKTGPRMADTLLVTEGETKRRFRIVIALDVPYPMQAALDAIVPPAVIPTPSGPPAGGETGWFYHLDARNVQLTRILPLDEPSGEELPPAETHDHEAVTADASPGGTGERSKGCVVRLMETEGRAQHVRLRCFQRPSSARQRDFHGRTITELQVEDDSVLLDMTAYEIADVELRF